MENATVSASGFAVPGWLAVILQLIIAAALPILLLLINARLLMAPAFMQLEYNRPNFPPDPYGFTTEDRLEYGPRGLAYLFNNHGTEYLGDLKFENGEPVFNERELSHMHDVKLVTQKLVRFGIGLLAIYIVTIVLLAISPSTRVYLWRGLFSGSLLTIGLLILGVGAVIFAFPWLFTQFHNLFFAGGTWIFPTSDTLIRLYPEEFWIDAFIVMFGGALLEAIIIGAICWQMLRKVP